jgi:hypothetical protein
LADPFARDVECPPNPVERPRVLAAEAVAQLEHATLAIAQVLERLAERLVGEDLGCPLGIELAGWSGVGTHRLAPVSASS